MLRNCPAILLVLTYFELQVEFETSACLSAEDAVATTQTQPTGELAPIDLSGFRSGIQHWRELRDDSRFIKVVPNQPSFKPDQVREIVSNILLFQRANGGWPKDYDMTAVLTNEQRNVVIETRERDDSSYDNDNIHSQVNYLARAFSQSHDPAWRRACERGFDFMLASQSASGGFPQRFPNPKGYAAHITYNDGVMIGILNVLQDAAKGEAHFAWLDSDRRAKAVAAVESGVRCILKTQIIVDGTLTGWCQQHDERSYEARPARTFELASICPQETTSIVKFLQRQPQQSPALTKSIDSAVSWMQHVRLRGIRITKIDAPREEFLRKTVDYDVVVIEDLQTPSLWARHYEIGTNRPVFAGRDGVKKYALAEIERERRTGTPWYGTWPESVLRGKQSPAGKD